MKVALVALLLAATISIASAQGGMNLYWGDCAETGQTVRTFACNTVGAPFTLYYSVIVPHEMSAFAAASVSLDFIFDATDIPPWWQVWPGGCRANAVAMTFDPVLLITSCNDLWQGTPNLSVFQVEPALVATNMLRLSGRGSLATGTEIPVLPDGQELVVGKVTISRALTVGPTACAGCGIGACIRLNQIRLDEAPGLPKWTVTNPARNTWVTWQSGYPGSCLFFTPAQNRTWGAIKTLYR